MRSVASSASGIKSVNPHGSKWTHVDISANPLDSYLSTILSTPQNRSVTASQRLVDSIRARARIVTIPIYICIYSLYRIIYIIKTITQYYINSLYSYTVPIGL